MKYRRLKALLIHEGDLMCIDEINGVSFELTQREFMRLYNLYKKTLKTKELSKENYSFDDFMSDVFTLFLKKLDNDELELIVNDWLES